HHSFPHPTGRRSGWRLVAGDHWTGHLQSGSRRIQWASTRSRPGTTCHRSDWNEKSKGGAMFSLFESSSKATRRDFLRIGTLGLGGLTLSQLLGARARAAAAGTGLAEKSVIFLFQHGGPSQYETFDPKMSAPAEIRCQTGEIATSLPGITFGSTLPRLARLADKIAVVRSYVPGDGSHDAKPIVHRETLGCNLGAFYSRVVGLNHPTTGMPTNMLLTPQAIDPAAQGQRFDLGNFPATGPLGNAYAPFIPGGNTT